MSNDWDSPFGKIVLAGLAVLVVIWLAGRIGGPDESGGGQPESSNAAASNDSNAASSSAPRPSAASAEPSGSADCRRFWQLTNAVVAHENYESLKSFPGWDGYQVAVDVGQANFMRTCERMSDSQVQAFITALEWVVDNMDYMADTEDLENLDVPEW